MAEIQFPITVTGVDFAEGQSTIRQPLFSGKIGDFVSVRPCAAEYEGKTFLGVLIGDVALGIGVSFNPQTGRVTPVRHMYNPGILIPDLGKIVYGAESWWGLIKTPDDLKQITDLDIDNVWYVQALKKLAAAPQGESQ
jgi:hypothetical protein